MSLIEANRIVAFGLVVLIWLVQLVIYPAFAEIAADGFAAWHGRYTRAITLVVAPLMLAQVALAIALLARRRDPATIAYALLVASTWIATAFVAVPIHDALATGRDPARIERLVRTNWVRTVAWTLAFLALLVRSK